MPSKLEESWKRGLTQASTTGAHEQHCPAPAAAGSTATAARSQSTKPGRDASLLFFGSPALSPGLSRPLGLGWLVARPVRRCPSRHSWQARRSRRLSQHRHRPLGQLLAAPSPAHTVRLSCLAGASPLTRLPPTPCSYSPRRLAHVPCSARCR